MDPLHLAMLSSFEIVLLLGVALAFICTLPLLALATYALIRGVARPGVPDARQRDQSTSPPQ